SRNEFLVQVPFMSAPLKTEQSDHVVKHNQMSNGRSRSSGGDSSAGMSPDMTDLPPAQSAAPDSSIAGLIVNPSSVGATLEAVNRGAPRSAATPKTRFVFEQQPLSVPTVSADPQVHEGRMRSLAHSIASSAEAFVAKIKLPTASPHDAPLQSPTKR